MVEDGYGKVLGRLNVGATESAVQAELHVGLDYGEPAAHQRAPKTWDSVSARTGQDR